MYTPLEYGACGLSEAAALDRFGAEKVEVYHTSSNPNPNPNPNPSPNPNPNPSPALNPKPNTNPNPNPNPKPNPDQVKAAVEKAKPLSFVFGPVRGGT